MAGDRVEGGEPASQTEMSLPKRQEESACGSGIPDATGKEYVNEDR